MCDVHVDNVFLSCDTNNKSAFASQEKTCDGVVLMLLANKLDLADSRKRKVTAEQGQTLAAVRHILNIQTTLCTDLLAVPLEHSVSCSNTRLCFTSAAPEPDATWRS